MICYFLMAWSQLTNCVVFRQLRSGVAEQWEALPNYTHAITWSLPSLTALIRTSKRIQWLCNCFPFARCSLPPSHRESFLTHSFSLFSSAQTFHNTHLPTKTHAEMYACKAVWIRERERLNNSSLCKKMLSIEFWNRLLDVLSFPLGPSYDLNGVRF